MSDSLRPHGCSSAGSSVHGFLQARTLEWAAIAFSRGSSWPKDQTWASRIVGKFFTIWATKEAPTILKWVSPSPGSFPSLGIEPWSPAFREDSLPKWNYKAALNNTWVKRPAKISQHLRIMFVKTNYPIDRVSQKLLQRFTAGNRTEGRCSACAWEAESHKEPLSYSGHKKKLDNFKAMITESQERAKVLTQGSNPGLLHCRQILHHLNNQGNPGPQSKCVLSLSHSVMSDTLWPHGL